MKFAVKLLLVAIVLGGVSVSTLLHRTGAALSFLSGASHYVVDLVPGKSSMIVSDHHEAHAATRESHRASTSLASWQGKVFAVLDGDTIDVLHDGRQERIRFYGVDAPEKKQDFGQKAKQFVSDRVFGKTVEVRPAAIDQYGRTVGEIVVDGKYSVNAELVANGFAWVYRQYCKESQCREWAQYEDEARNTKRGLWSVPNPTPPWEFRHK